MIDVELATFTDVAAVPPTFTVAPVLKPEPVIVIASPPYTYPVDGATTDTAGAGADRVVINSPPEALTYAATRQSPFDDIEMTGAGCAAVVDASVIGADQAVPAFVVLDVDTELEIALLLHTIPAVAPSSATATRGGPTSAEAVFKDEALVQVLP